MNVLDSILDGVRADVAARESVVDFAAVKAAAAAAGLRTDLRLATWDVKPWHDGADFAVTILRPA